MNAMMQPPRHGVLFEMLRRQNMSDQTGHAVSHADQEAIDHAQAQAFLARALRSWDAPVRFMSADEDETGLAPEPRRDNEFFRAVRP